MTEQEIIDNNKLITEFIGFYFRNEDICQSIKGWITGLETMTYNPKTYLKFHSSWDWLMPVVKECLNKSEKILDNWEYYYEQIDDSFFQVEINQTYQMVIKFINWYNQNKE